MNPSLPRRSLFIRSSTLRRALHVARFLVEALAVSTVISAIMIAWVLFDGGAR